MTDSELKAAIAAMIYTIRPEVMAEIPFTQTVPGKSFYRHDNWAPGEYKQFRHEHTMSSNLNGFTFWNRTKPKEP